MRIYLNSSAWNRPLDDLSAPRVRREAEAVAALLERVEAGRVELVTSDYLQFEVEQDADRDRSHRILALLSAASAVVRLSATIAMRAREFERVGLRGLDALHVAFAEAGRATLLVTTDDRMLKRAGRLRPSLPVRTVLPQEALRLLDAEEGR